MDAVFIILALVTGVGLAFALAALTNRQFDRKLEREADARYRRTLELARQGKCPYPPPREHNPAVKVNR